MILNSNEVKELVKYLNTSKVEDRQVIYHAVGIALGSKLLNTNPSYVIAKESKELKLRVKKIVYELNEVAVVDRTQLENVMYNYICYKIDDSAVALLEVGYNASNFNDILGVSKYYGASDTELINKNIGLFKLALLAATRASDEIVRYVNEYYKG